MQNTKNEKTIMDVFSRKIKIHQIIWAALGMSIVFYGALPFLLPELLNNKSEFIPENLLYAIAGSLAGGSIIVGQFFLDPNRLIKISKQLPGSFEDNFPNALLVPNVISWALNEAIATLGFVNSLTTGNHQKSLQLIGVALALHLLTFPSYSKAKAILDNVKTKMR